jgi:hypothetical protein
VPTFRLETHDGQHDTIEANRLDITGASELTRLADKAAAHSDGQAVAVVRGFDQSSRHRAAELRRKLRRRGIPAVDLTPLVLRLRHNGRSPDARAVLDIGAIGLVVDTGVGTGGASALAAELGVPLLHQGAARGRSRRSVIGVFTGTDLIAVALERVELRPLDRNDCQLSVRTEESAPVLVTGGLTVHLPQPDAGPTADLPLMSAERRLDVKTPLHLAAHWGPYTLVIDDRPFSAMAEPVTLRCLVDRLERLSA